MNLVISEPSTTVAAVSWIVDFTWLCALLDVTFAGFMTVVVKQSNGMRIAPPEAPASGYLFGKVFSCFLLMREWAPWIPFDERMSPIDSSR